MELIQKNKFHYYFDKDDKWSVLYNKGYILIENYSKKIKISVKVADDKYWKYEEQNVDLDFF